MFSLSLRSSIPSLWLVLLLILNNIIFIYNNKLILNLRDELSWVLLNLLFLKPQILTRKYTETQMKILLIPCILKFWLIQIRIETLVSTFKPDDEITLRGVHLTPWTLDESKINSVDEMIWNASWISQSSGQLHLMLLSFILYCISFL